MNGQRKSIQQRKPRRSPRLQDRGAMLGTAEKASERRYEKKHPALEQFQRLDSMQTYTRQRVMVSKVAMTSDCYFRKLDWKSKNVRCVGLLVLQDQSKAF